MHVLISINLFPLNLCFHTDCVFVILVLKLFCRDVVVLRDFQFIKQILEFFRNTVHKASDLYALYRLHKAQIFVLHRQISYTWLSSHPRKFSSDCDLAMSEEGKEGNKHRCCLNEQIQEAWKTMGLYPLLYPVKYRVL